MQNCSILQTAQNKKRDPEQKLPGTPPEVVSWIFTWVERQREKWCQSFPHCPRSILLISHSACLLMAGAPTGVLWIQGAGNSWQEFVSSEAGAGRMGQLHWILSARCG